MTTEHVSSATHPIIPGFYPDPTVCRAGSRYYLANSSFEYFPGAPLFAGEDLLTWAPVANILTRRSQFARGDGRPSGGIFGSTLRFFDGRFWFITTNMSDFGTGHLIVSAEDPAGPWSEPVFVAGAIGIDPDLAWDEDGTCYLTWCGFSPDPDQSGVVQARVDLATGRLLDTPARISSGSGLQFPEGPHLYHRGAYWYLLLAEGGTERGHAVTVARGTSPRGPFDQQPGGPLFSRRSTDSPVQNTGHADLVELADGGWAAVYLGVRPQGASPGFHVLGRETFLAGIDWVDDWPVFVPDRFELPVPHTAFEDSFAAPPLDLRWVVPGGEAESFATFAEEGGLVLTGAGKPSELLCARVRDLSWEATAEVDLTVGGARFVLRLDDRSWYAVEADAVEADADRIRAVGRAGDFLQEFGAIASAGTRITLGMTSVPPAGAGQLGVNIGPDDIVLWADGGSGRQQLARIDGRYLATEVAGGFTGRVLGVGALAGRTRVVRVTYRPL